MSKLTLIANIYAKPDKIDHIKTEALKLIDPTRAEEGCIQYDLNQDNENPAHFIFYEIWETHEHWEAHMNTPHLKAYKESIDDAIDQLILNEMKQIG